MSQEVALRIGGANVYWSLGPSLRSKVVAAFDAHGLKEYTPEPKTPEACLRHALAASIKPAKGDKVVVRPLEDKRGFGVHTMPKKCPDDCSDDRVTHVVTATLPKDGTDFTAAEITFTPHPDIKTYDAICKEFDAAKHTLSVGVMSKAMVGVIEDYFCGVSLKPNGGLYWIDKCWLNMWRRFAADVEKCVTEDADSALYTMPVIAGEEMVRAVGDALTSEISGEVDRIESEVASVEMNVRVTERHLKRAAELQKKVGNYAECFGKPLTELQDMLQRAVAASAMATLKVSAASVAPSMQSSAA
jgi:hypothetical protein